MKLLRFYIGKYRVLQNLDIHFDRKTTGQPNIQQDYSLDFLAGVNGTGKSTVLHLLGRLFAQLLTETYYFPVSVELVYSLENGESLVTVSNSTDEDAPEETNGVLRYKVNDGDWLAGKIPSNLLPRQIVIYTTGSESAWLDELSKTDGQETTVAGVIAEEDEATAYLRELPGHKQTMAGDESSNVDFDNPLLFIQSERLPLVALCGLLASRKHQRDSSAEKETLHDVLESISLDSLAGFSLRIRSQRSLTHPTQQEVINELDRVADHRVRQGSDTLLVFNIAEQLAREQPAGEKSIFDLYESPIALFQRLNYLYEHRPYYDPPLQEVNLFFKRRATVADNGEAVDDPMLQSFDWLSDGEQSFLGRMALFSLFRAPGMLIMLDEPEVHFNDIWKREIVNMLDKIMADNSSHALITTHSSILLTDVPSEDILVIRRKDRVSDETPPIPELNINTLGADPSDILVHVFGSHSATGQRSISFLRNEIGRRETVEELNELKEIVAPGYWQYRIQLEVQRLTS